MALTADASGAQTFTPDVLNDQTDLLELMRGRILRSGVKPLGRPQFSQPRQVGPGLWLGKMTLHGARGGLRQEGAAVDAGEEFAYSDMVCDDWDIMRHSFLVNTAATPSPAIPDRVSWANFHAKSQMAMAFYDPGTDKIYVEDKTTGIMSTSAYAARANTGGLLCMKPVMINGSPFLGLGWSGNLSGVSTFELVDKLSTGYASTADALGQAATWGIHQSPVAGNPILVYRGSDIWAIRAADVAIGATTYTKMLSGLPEGGYCIGQLSFGGGVTYVAWAVPENGTSAFYSPSSLAVGAGRLKIILTDLYGFYVSELHLPIPFVRFATVFLDGLFVCDGISHWWVKTPSDLIPVDRASDWPANSDKERRCRGHAIQNDRAIWVVNEVATTHGTGNTNQWFMEYDSHLNISRPVSPEQLSTFGDEITAGGHSQPISSYTNLLHVYTTSAYSSGGSSGLGTWHSQFQPPANVVGYGTRQTSGAQTNTGQEFAAVGNFGTPKYDGYPGFEGCPVMAVGFHAPQTRRLLTGGAGTYLDVTCAGRTVRFSSTEPNARPARKDIVKPSIPWSYDLQLTAVSHRTTTETSPTRWTPNIFPLSVDVLIRADPDPAIPDSAKRADFSRSRRR